MIINGLGLTPIKDVDGNPDKKKNKLWVRFVDPDTEEVLAKEYEVNPDDLSDDQAMLFNNAAHNQLNVVYRRPDGNIGWIAPSNHSAS